MISIFSSITDTLAYFDQFSYPLTDGELYHHLWQPPVKDLTYPEFLIQLEQAVAIHACEQTAGYLHLPGRQPIANERRRRLLLVEKKMKIARRAARVISRVPFVQAIGVCNTVSAGWPTEQSDIDVFVVVREGRLWLTRLLVTGVTALANIRRHRHHVTDLVCLSFYITDKHLDISAVCITQPDIYLIYWIKQLIPLYDPENIIDQFLESNRWTNEYVPFGTLDKETLASSRVTDTYLGGICKHALAYLLQSSLGDWLEHRVRSWQRRRIEVQSHAPEPSVVISDSMLKFHEEDRRREYQEEWLRRRSLYRVDG